MANLLQFSRTFSSADQHPYEEITWVKKHILMENSKGDIIYELKDAEFPDFWSELSCKIAASKYFLTDSKKTSKETSLRQLIDRVVDTISKWGLEQKYFDEDVCKIFSDELKWLMVNQYAIFNTPIMLNFGTNISDRAGACFILDVEDSLESIYETLKIEADVFKSGSGSGLNISKLRGRNEPLSVGGNSSGILAFMKLFDTSAGSIKSGGRSRRSARLVCIDEDHPDVEEFIGCKAKEEKKAHALIGAGFDGSFDGEVTNTIAYQNANHSVRLTDSFMEKVIKDENYDLINRVDGSISKTVRARDILMKISENAHFCGDPGVMFHDTTNDWFTCSDTGEITAANPCIEFTHLPYTSCLLSAFNILKFKKGSTFYSDKFEKAIEVLVTAKDIIIDKAEYPLDKIAKNSSDYRPLGLGFTNLGSLLMNYGLSYDSEDGRDLAASIASLMTAKAYEQSHKIALVKGSFLHYKDNKRSFHRVLKKHTGKTYVSSDTPYELSLELFTRSAKIYSEIIYEEGFRNSAVTLFAPNGTTGLVLGGDTTGIEPCLALVSYKKLIGGGTIKIVNESVKEALKSLKYDEKEVEDILEYIRKNDTIEGSVIKDEHLPVFDCSFKASKGSRYISYKGHVDMMSALQPNISMSQSKTVNMPNEATVEDIFDVFVDSWKKGLKSITIYRDGSKVTQPLNTSEEKVEEKVKVIHKPVKKSMPSERKSISHKFDIGGHEGYLTLGFYEDGTPGELFIRMSKEGSIISGLMDSFAISISLGLQYGIPIEDMVEKFINTRFEPSGITKNPEIPMAKSIMDYVFQWVSQKVGVGFRKEIDIILEPFVESSDEVKSELSDGPPCPTCSSLTTRNGSCFLCRSCGSTTGCS